MPQDGLEDIRALCNLEPEIMQSFKEQSQSMTVPSGTKVFESGSDCGAFLIVVSGSVRVQMIGENGREIVLYRVSHGETCILTTACLLSNEAYNAEAITETETTAVALPASWFHKFIDNSEHFRNMVFENYGQRISNLVLLVEEVAFKRLDVRLAQFLIEHAQNDMLSKTHQDLASELGTAREVVSRQLKEFERKEWIVLSRGQITIENKQALFEFITRHCD